MWWYRERDFQMIYTFRGVTLGSYKSIQGIPGRGMIMKDKTLLL